MIHTSFKRNLMRPLASEKGSIIAAINLLLAGLLVLGAAGWPFVQKGWQSWMQREAKGFFQRIEDAQYRYKNVNNRYLPFSMQEGDNALKQLKLDPKKAQYFRYSVEQMGKHGFRIIAHARPQILKKWYLYGPKARFRLVYEKKEGEKGAVLP